MYLYSNGKGRTLLISALAFKSKGLRFEYCLSEFVRSYEICCAKSKVGSCLWIPIGQDGFEGVTQSKSKTPITRNVHCKFKGHDTVYLHKVD